MSLSSKSGRNDGNATDRAPVQARTTPGKKLETQARYGDTATVQMKPREVAVQRAEAESAEDADRAATGEAATDTATDAQNTPGKAQLVKSKPKQLPEGGIEGDEDSSAGGDVQVTPAAGATTPAAGRAAPVQGKGDIAPASASVHDAAGRGVAGAGGSLPHIDAIQAAFGLHDVSGVRAHTGPAAAGACQAISAEAYATGTNVAFADANPSLHTAAHEAAHVVQQRGGVQLKGGVGHAGDGYERNADEVADRVVQGESAEDLLTPFSGHGADAGVQRKETTDRGHPEPAPATPSGSSTTTGSAAKAQRYEVELKAWIPHSKVVDPEEPARASDWLDTISSVANGIANTLPGVRATLKYKYHSYYRGDGHSGYSGGYRVLSRASFNWDGSTITNFTRAGFYGTTHRDYDYRAWLDISAGIGPFRKSLYTKTITSGTGTEAATASKATSGSKRGSSGFSLGMASANPVVMTWAPDIDSILRGTMTSSGMSLSYTTDLFPSHGIQVKRDGKVIKSQIVNDASGVNALGVFGAMNVGRRLMSFSNKGSTTAP